MVRTIPALPLLRRWSPASRLAWLVEEGPAALLQGHHDLDEVIVLPRQALVSLLGEPGTFFEAFAAILRLSGGLRRRRFDIALDFHGTFKSGLASRASGAPVRYGYAPPGSKECNRLFNNRHVPMPGTPVHRIDRTLAMVRALGGPADSVGVELPIGGSQREAVGRWLAAAGAAGEARVLLFPGTSRRQDFKRYPSDRFAEVARLLASRPGLDLVVAGGPGEQELAGKIAAGTGGRAFVAPPLGLLELAELIRRCDLFIGPDTGPMHIAWAVGTRVLALFGPTDPALNAPWGEGHTVLYNQDFGRNWSGLWPEPAQVARAAEEMLPPRPR